MIDYLEDGETFEEFINDKYVKRTIKRIINDIDGIKEQDIIDKLLEA